MLGDRISGLAAQDVVQAGLSAAFIAQTEKVLEGIRDPPAGEEVDRDVELVRGRHVRWVAIPLENALVDRIDAVLDGPCGLDEVKAHTTPIDPLAG